ncbi:MULTISPECIES: DUF3084 domain-containing protein [unclassified Synechococcus]|uniref:DUF3084 domain-containing protein n=3 Tax=Synechococcus TaxID=1129 RepID=UPI0018CCE45A|nr:MULTISPECIES: DUF3084 domain-containing protein [unclassified Synechococcus]MEA5422870.1 DUF3084 domain-containing protein [Synechococcus sp. CCY9202]QPN61144.1 DUF3084 domain-containing protein [Synechococcus sp. CBW1002]QPN67201.1 DUF3084 domain-containing protein [Synechococcus sp. CBW1006]CAK6701629.1 hypothetical protein IFHNHDMJ_03171 [Synechococcus sp. CBW1107]
MTGWLLILVLLVLGGVLSTLGDRLGSRVGKARLSLFNLRPRRTAVLITVLTGSLISAMSLGLMLLVSQRLRVGLFELDQLEQRLQQSRDDLARSRRDLVGAQAASATAQQASRRAQAATKRVEGERKRAQAQRDEAEKRLQQLRRELLPLQQQRARLEAERDRLSRDVANRDQEIRRTETELAAVQEQIKEGEKELQGLETKIIALRRGDVVISSGQPLATAKVTLERPEQARDVINTLLQQANRLAFQRVLPGEPPDRQILLVPRNDIAKLETLLARPGSWVVSLLSAANVLRGEQQVLAFPDLRPNRPVARAGDVLATTSLEPEVHSPQQVNSRLNLLLAAAYAKVQRQGSITDGLQFDAALLNQLARSLSERPEDQAAQLEAVAVQDADTPDPIVVELRWIRPRNGRP